MQGKLQGRCVVWISSWALQIHCKRRVSLGANHLISKGWIEIDDTVLQRIYVIWDRFCILCKWFVRPFEVKEPSFPGSCFCEDEKHLFLISQNEKRLSLKKSFWKVYHYSKCLCHYYTSFVFSSIINIRETSL